MQRYLSDLRLFSRDARLFLAAATIFAFSIALPSVFTVLYFQALGFDRPFIGLTNTAVLVGGAASLPLAMWLLDRFGRRRAAIFGLLTNWSVWALAMTLTRGDLLLIALVVSGFGNVLYGLTVVPLLAESSSTRERTTLFATYEGLLTLALFFGSLLAGLVPGVIAHLLDIPATSAVAYRGALLSSLVIRALGLIPLLRIHYAGAHAGASTDVFAGASAGIPAGAPVSVASEPGVTDVLRAIRAPRPPAQVAVFGYLNPRKLARLESPVWLLILPYSLIHFAASLFQPFLPLILRADYGAGDAVISSTLGIANLSIGIASVLVPLVVVRLGRIGVVVGACALTAALTLGNAWAPTFILAASAIVARAGVINSTAPVYRAFSIDHTPVAEYTIVSLLLQLCANVGPAIAPPLSGYIQKYFGIRPVFEVSAALYLVSAVLFGWVMKRTRDIAQR